MRSRTSPFRTGAALAGAALLVLTACSDARAGDELALADRPLAAHQLQLLDLAFDVASSMPVHPHIKNRSRAQEGVVEAALELGQPRRALGYIERIDNWRRGVGYADLAFYCAREGATREVQRYLELAAEVAESASEENVGEAIPSSSSGDNAPAETAQSWRRDRINVKIASTHALLGREEQARRLEAGVVPSETGKVAAARAMVLDAEEFQKQIDAVELLIATSDLDQVRNALEACAQLFDRFYDDAERRAYVEEKVKVAGPKLPATVRIPVLLELVEFALARDDRAKALELIDDTKRIMDAAMCEHIPLVARLAGLRHRAGDAETARKETDLALANYERDREEIVNIERAGLLRPVAEAYQEMGDLVAALRVYRKALEEGVVNPNSRPRAEDLSATCASMARHGVEPDAELWARIHEIYAELGDPW